MPVLLLASASPRRRQLLLEFGLELRTVPGSADETRISGEEPQTYALRVAEDKAAAAVEGRAGDVILAADTVVVVDEHVLGKPADESDFRRMMKLLSGRSHEVITAVVARVVDGASAKTAVRTKVSFRPLLDEEIAWYWSTGEPQDKAGGYALQGKAGAFVTGIEGSPSNVIGLPLLETVALLQKLGFQLPWNSPT